MKTNKTLSEKALEKIIKERCVRIELARNSHLWFFNIYFADYMEYETAPFQYELLDLTERNDWNLLCVVAFRNSAKTTILNTSHVLWSILGNRQSKFVLIVSQTQAQAKQAMMNIRGVLESNDMLKRDLGPFKEETNEWGSSTIVFSRYAARISVASVNESIRGIKHLKHRPDLVVIDDPEDIQSVKTKESRDKIYNWFKGEIMPIGSKKTRVVVIGNALHEHCLVSKLKSEITQNKTSGIYREYPIVTDSGVIMWPGRFKNMKDIEDERKRIGNDKSWFREFMLKNIPDEDQIIKREWIQYYDTLPNRDDEKNEYRLAASAVDLGVKDKERSDPTAVVSGFAFGSGKNGKIYISPAFFNSKVSFLSIIENLKKISASLDGNQRTRMYIETVAAQSYVFQQMKCEGYPVYEYNPRGDKAERLANISPLIQNGQIVFHKGCEEIINQIVNFGLENHDDLADAFTCLVRELMEIIGHSSSDIGISMTGSTIMGPIRNMKF